MPLIDEVGIEVVDEEEEGLPRPLEAVEQLVDSLKTEDVGSALDSTLGDPNFVKLQGSVRIAADAVGVLSNDEHDTLETD